MDAVRLAVGSNLHSKRYHSNEFETVASHYGSLAVGHCVDQRKRGQQQSQGTPPQPEWDVGQPPVGSSEMSLCGPPYVAIVCKLKTIYLPHGTGRRRYVIHKCRAVRYDMDPTNRVPCSDFTKLVPWETSCSTTAVPNNFTHANMLELVLTHLSVFLFILAGFCFIQVLISLCKLAYHCAALLTV